MNTVDVMKFFARRYPDEPTSQAAWQYVIQRLFHNRRILGVGINASAVRFYMPDQGRWLVVVWGVDAAEEFLPRSDAGEPFELPPGWREHLRQRRHDAPPVPQIRHYPLGNPVRGARGKGEN